MFCVIFREQGSSGQAIPPALPLPGETQLWEGILGAAGVGGGGRVPRLVGPNRPQPALILGRGCLGQWPTGEGTWVTRS